MHMKDHLYSSIVYCHNCNTTNQLFISECMHITCAHCQKSIGNFIMKNSLLNSECIVCDSPTNFQKITTEISNYLISSLESSLNLFNFQKYQMMNRIASLHQSNVKYRELLVKCKKELHRMKKWKNQNYFKNSDLEQRTYLNNKYNFKNKNVNNSLNNYSFIGNSETKILGINEANESVLRRQKHNFKIQDSKKKHQNDQSSDIDIDVQQILKKTNNCNSNVPKRTIKLNYQPKQYENKYSNNEIGKYKADSNKTNQYIKKLVKSTVQIENVSDYTSQHSIGTSRISLGIRRGSRSFYKKKRR